MEYGNIDFQSEEYAVFKEASRKYYEAKEKFDRYTMMYRITKHDTHVKLISEQRRILPQLAGEKRRSWYELLKKTREAQANG